MSASFASDPDKFRLAKADMDPFVRGEIQAHCAPGCATWPAEFFVFVGDYTVCFYDLDSKLLIEITSDDYGFEATRAYMALLCVGCPARGTAVEKAADGFFR